MTYNIMRIYRSEKYKKNKILKTSTKKKIGFFE